MSLYFPPWDDSTEPQSSNVRSWLDHLTARLKPQEQARWNEAHIDTMFYAGAQSYLNRQFNFGTGISSSNYHFNLLQQPVNMVTGFQRQHRKSINYIPTEGADPKTTDQYTRLMMHVCNVEGINEAYSKACELSAISGKVLMQPYLDYAGDDPAQGQMKVKIWEYNSFMCDPYYRDASMSDCQLVWCQEFITNGEAKNRFPDKKHLITPMLGSSQGLNSFYFLPENYNMARNNMSVLSYVWYKWKRKKKRLYSDERNQFFDYGGGQEQLDEILYHIPDLEIVEVEVPTWKLCVVLNDQLMFQGDNPLGFDECPFISVDWNYEPHVSESGLRVRSLVRSMRDANFLMNRRIILNHKISEASTQGGWKRKSGAVANEENLKQTDVGYDVIINEGYELTDAEKIIPNAVPASDLQLADQLSSLIFSVSGINLENWSAQEDSQASSLTVLMKQAANLMVLQKYFDQWDYSFKLLGDVLLKITLNNWNAAKVSLIIGEDPSPHFYSRIFAKYQVIVEEGLNTATQKNMQARQLIEINQIFGREVFPPSMIVKDMNLSGKGEAMQFLQQQEQQAAAAAEHEQTVAHSLEEARLKEMYSKAVHNIASARERHGRAEADIGLFEERLSEISHNRAMATKAKMEALEKMIDVIQRYGEIETMLKMNQIETYDHQQIAQEDVEKVDAKRTAMSNDFVTQMLASQGRQQPQEQQQEQGNQQFG